MLSILSDYLLELSKIILGSFIIGAMIGRKIFVRNSSIIYGFVIFVLFAALGFLIAFYEN